MTELEKCKEHVVSIDTRVEAARKSLRYWELELVDAGARLREERDKIASLMSVLHVSDALAEKMVGGRVRVIHTGGRVVVEVVTI